MCLQAFSTCGKTRTLVLTGELLANLYLQSSHFTAALAPAPSTVRSHHRWGSAGYGFTRGIFLVKVLKTLDDGLLPKGLGVRQLTDISALDGILLL